MTVYTTVPLDDSNLDVTVTENGDLVSLDINPAAFATIGASKEYVDDGDAATLSSANLYTDNSIAAIPAVDLSAYETIVNSNAGDATTLSSANTYTDTSIAAIPAVDLSSYETIVNSNAGDVQAVADANTYTDTSIAAIPATDLSAYETIVNSNAGDATTLSSANTYTDTSIAAIPATDLSAYSTTVQVEALPVSTFTNDAGYITTETDSQTLSFATPNISISGGNSVDLTPLTLGYITADSTNTLTNKSGAISQWTNDSAYLTASALTPYSTSVQVAALPVSTFTNDSAYLTGSALTPYSTTVQVAALPVSTFTNDAGYSTTTGTVTPSSTDTFTNKSGAISQWTNDSAYLTGSALTPYSTTVQVEALPVSTFTNDAGYLTTETDSQTLSFATPNLTISNGNTVDLSALTPTVPVTSVNTLIGAVVLDTDDVLEGTTNLYHTTPRVQAVINTNTAGYATTTYVDTNDATTLSSANTYTDTSIAAIDLANLSDVVTIDPDSSGMTIGATGVTTAKWGSSAPLFWRSDSDDGALKNFVFDNTSQNIFTGMHWKTADSNKKLFRFDATASGGTDPGDGSHTTNFTMSGTNNIFKSRLQNETKTGLEFDANDINLVTTDGVSINSNYTLPNVDGNQDQQLTTDGNGNVSWGDTHSVIDDSGTAPNMTTRNGNTTAFQFISDDQDYNGAYSATLNMISWANLASNNIAFVSYKTTNNNQMLNLKASGSADDGSHQADFTLRGAEGYFSTRDNSSGSGALTDMIFEGTDLTFQASGEIGFEAPRTNVKGLLTISDGVSDYTLPASDGTAGQVLSTNGNGQLSWVTP